MDLGNLVSRSPSNAFPYPHHHNSAAGTPAAHSTLPHPFPSLAQQSFQPPLMQQQQQQHPQAPQQALMYHPSHATVPSPSTTRFERATLTVQSQKVFDEAALYPDCKLGYWTYNPTVRLPLFLRINGVFHAHIPRRFLDFEQNTALRRRKVWGTDVYTDDSDIAAILMHSAMAQRIPKSGDIKVTLRVMPRLVAYKSSMRHDLRSRGWVARHDGLSLVVEDVAGVSSLDEVKGKGYAKRAIEERARLAAETSLQAAPALQVDWPPEITRRRVRQSVKPRRVARVSKSTKESVQEKDKTPGPDDTIEVEMDDQEVGESSFVEPASQGPLISSKPDTLPTGLAMTTASVAKPQEALAAETATAPAGESEASSKPVAQEEVDIRKRELTGQDILAAARRITDRQAGSESPVAELSKKEMKSLAHAEKVATGRKEAKPDAQQAQVEGLAAMIEKEGRPVAASGASTRKTTSDVEIDVKISD